jgi:hypothetical protein
MSPLLPGLLKTLNTQGVTTIIVDNAQKPTKAKEYAQEAGVLYRHRPGWRIYKTWNFGIRIGAIRNENVLVLNDDIMITGEGIAAMNASLKEDWALLGFDYNTPFNNGYSNGGIREASGSYRLGGVDGCAFGVNPRKCGRCDRRFIWWGGDDDIFHHTKSLGGKVGLMMGNALTHISTTTGKHTMPHLPEGWFKHDQQLLLSKWGETWGD